MLTKKNLKSRNHRFHWSIRWVWAHIAPLPFSTPLSMCNPIVHIRYVTQNKLHNFNFVYIFKNAWMFCYVLELKWSIESKLFRLSTSFVLKVLIHQPININQSQHQHDTGGVPVNPKITKSLKYCFLRKRYNLQQMCLLLKIVLPSLNQMN